MGHLVKLRRESDGTPEQRWQTSPLASSIANLTRHALLPGPRSQLSRRCACRVWLRADHAVLI